MKKWPQTSLVILWLLLSWVSSEDKVIQSLPSLLVYEAGNTALNCSYQVANFQSLYWYKQEEKALTLLFRLISSATEKKSGRIRGVLDTKALLSTLHITATQLGDAATYLCAAQHSALQPPAACTQMKELRLYVTTMGILRIISNISYQENGDKQ